MANINAATYLVLDHILTMPTLLYESGWAIVEGVSYKGVGRLLVRSGSWVVGGSYVVIPGYIRVRLTKPLVVLRTSQSLSA